MASDFSNYGFGRDGVNLTKNPLEMGDGEASQLQNAELRLDQATVGESALGKRGGFVALNGSALASTVLGMIGLNLKTTYTRTLYVGRGTQNSNTWRTTTDGTTFSNTSTPPIPAAISKFSDANGVFNARRPVAWRNFIVFPFNTYTKGTDTPPIELWDGSESFTLSQLTVGPSATASTVAFTITDSIVAGGYIYFAVHDPGGAAPDLCGRVMRINLETGRMEQVGPCFGNTSANGEITGGYPQCLCWYQDQIWAGLETGNNTDNIGKVVRINPVTDTNWTADTSTLSGNVTTLAVYKGDLYAGSRATAANNSKVHKRDATAGTWAASFTSTAGVAGGGFIASLIVYGTSLYCCEYWSGATDVIHIKAFDGTTWTTDRDVDASDGTDTSNPQIPGNAILFGSDLFFAFRPIADSDTAADGFVLKKSGGSWSKVDAAQNLNGMMVVLTSRS